MPDGLQKHLDRIQSTVNFFSEDCLKSQSEFCKKIFEESLKFSEARAVFPRGGSIGNNALNQALGQDGRYIKELILFGASVDGKPIGGILASTDKERPMGYIWGLYVEADYRKFNLASTLFSQAMEWLKSKGAKEIELVVKAGNEASISFYRSQGFSLKSYILRARKSVYSDKTYPTPHNRFV